MRIVSGFAEIIMALWEPDAIPYTPPAWHQIDALPAEEVLVRASDQPAVTPEELLRAAQAGTVEPAQELLRAGE